MSDLPSCPTIIDEPSSVPGFSSPTATVEDSIISSLSCTSTSLIDSSATHILQNSHPPALTVLIQSYAVASPLMQQSNATDQPKSSGNKSFARKYSLRSLSKQD